MNGKPAQNMSHPESRGEIINLCLYTQTLSTLKHKANTALEWQERHTKKTSFSGQDKKSQAR